MSWGAQNRSEDAKAPSVAGVWSEKPELDLWPIQQYEKTPTCAVHDKKRSHTLLNEDGDPGKNNNLELNTDVEYRAERMRK